MSPVNGPLWYFVLMDDDKWIDEDWVNSSQFLRFLSMEKFWRVKSSQFNDDDNVDEHNLAMEFRCNAVLQCIYSKYLNVWESLCMCMKVRGRWCEQQRRANLHVDIQRPCSYNIPIHKLIRYCVNVTQSLLYLVEIPHCGKTPQRLACWWYSKTLQF